nr:MAG TPA: hypothetical protein [Bacteriophage sp.]
MFQEEEYSTSSELFPSILTCNDQKNIVLVFLVDSFIFVFDVKILELKGEHQQPSDFYALWR